MCSVDTFVQLIATCWPTNNLKKKRTEFEASVSLKDVRLKPLDPQPNQSANWNDEGCKLNELGMTEDGWQLLPMAMDSSAAENSDSA